MLTCTGGFTIIVAQLYSKQYQTGAAALVSGTTLIAKVLATPSVAGNVLHGLLGFCLTELQHKPDLGALHGAPESLQGARKQLPQRPPVSRSN